MNIGLTNNNSLYFKSLLLYLFVMVSGCQSEGDENNIIPPEEQELVYKNTEAIQCESTGITVNESAQILINNGIDVTSSFCGFFTGLAVITVCGEGTQDIHLHLIHSQNTQDAINAGFELVSEIDTENGVGYSIVECDE